jgi:hypothetical protein
VNCWELLSNVVLHPRSFKFLSAPLRESQILQCPYLCHSVCRRAEHPALCTAMPAVHNMAVLSFGGSRHHLCAETQRLALPAAGPG